MIQLARGNTILAGRARGTGILAVVFMAPFIGTIFYLLSPLLRCRRRVIVWAYMCTVQAWQAKTVRRRTIVFRVYADAKVIAVRPTARHGNF